MQEKKKIRKALAGELFHDGSPHYIEASSLDWFPIQSN